MALYKYFKPSKSSETATEQNIWVKEEMKKWFMNYEVKNTTKVLRVDTNSESGDW